MYQRKEYQVLCIIINYNTVNTAYRKSNQNEKRNIDRQKEDNLNTGKIFGRFEFEDSKEEKVTELQTFNYGKIWNRKCSNI